MNTKNVTRLEIINHSEGPDFEKDGLCIGRQFVEYNLKDVELSLQDDGKTLKVFLNVRS